MEHKVNHDDPQINFRFSNKIQSQEPGRAYYLPLNPAYYMYIPGNRVGNYADAAGATDYIFDPGNRVYRKYYSVDLPVNDPDTDSIMHPLSKRFVLQEFSPDNRLNPFRYYSFKPSRFTHNSQIIETFLDNDMFKLKNVIALGVVIVLLIVIFRNQLS